ncbi:MAG: RagB/SusD family nutrient uptake outer membrane protein [Gemmatimonadetes bacterium]|nr:RagB/SusD family nutrient uptake outer membrane protein [Gemmatimonadota bacterium]
MKRRVLSLALSAALLLAGAACSDFLEVTNEGTLEDDKLNDPEAMPGLVGGMSGDLSVALGDVAFLTALMADELTYAGAYDYYLIPYNGQITPEYVNLQWDGMHRARWVAETGIERMKSVLGADFEKNELSPRAYLIAGFANRLLGENVCFAVIDGGPKQPVTVHLERAEKNFTEALRLAQAQGATALANAALAGRASVRADLGDWAGAVADAERVPAGFVYLALFSTNSSRENNVVNFETIGRFEASVWNTVWMNQPKDPRTPSDTAFDAGGKIRTGRDGKTPVIRQQKYKTLGDDIPLAKGTEMLLLRAEAALRDNDAPGAVALINQARDVYGLPAAAAAGLEEAWALLQRERGATLWLEARRLNDLRRWNADGRNDFLANRAKCLPISQKELTTNENLAGER